VEGGNRETASASPQSTSEGHSLTTDSLSVFFLSSPASRKNLRCANTATRNVGQSNFMPLGHMHQRPARDFFPCWSHRSPVLLDQQVRDSVPIPTHLNRYSVIRSPPLKVLVPHPKVTSEEYPWIRRLIATILQSRAERITALGFSLAAATSAYRAVFRGRRPSS
jgi:hypothetical protein